MTEGRAARLQGLPGWRWGGEALRPTEENAAKWEARFLALQAFLSESGGRYPSRGAAVPVRPPAAFYLHYA